MVYFNNPICLVKQIIIEINLLLAWKADKSSGSSMSSSTSSKKSYDPSIYSEHNADAAALKESLNKIKLLEYDYGALQQKRLQDVSTLEFVLFHKN